jgi:hypothetical protein
MSSDVRPIRLPAAAAAATNRRKTGPIRSCRIQIGSHKLRIVFRALERLPAQPVEAYHLKWSQQ